MKNKHLFPILVSLLLAMVAGSAHAQATTFSDNFDRANANNLGANYIYYNNFELSSSIFAISSNVAVSTSSNAQNGFALVNEGQFTVGQGKAFELEIDLQSDTTASNWAGFVFNFQDDSNFSYFRWKPSTGQVQAISVVNKGIVRYSAETFADFLTTETVHIKLSGDGSGNYVTTLARNGVDNAVMTWTDGIFTSGGVGIYYSGSGIGVNDWTYNNFYANIPESRATAISLALGAVIAFLYKRSRK